MASEWDFETVTNPEDVGTGSGEEPQAEKDAPAEKHLSMQNLHLQMLPWLAIMSTLNSGPQPEARRRTRHHNSA